MTPVGERQWESGSARAAVPAPPWRPRLETAHEETDYEEKEYDMPEKENTSIKDPDMYQALRDDGASQQKAARISNAAAKKGRSSVGRKGGKANSYEEWTVEQLRTKAKEINLTGYSRKRKGELIEALRDS